MKAVKTYSFLDQAPIQQVDIHDGLENTLTIHKHKLKAGVDVKREALDGYFVAEYLSELPRANRQVSGRRGAIRLAVVSDLGSLIGNVWLQVVEYFR